MRSTAKRLYEITSFLRHYLVSELTPTHRCEPAHSSASASSLLTDAIQRLFCITCELAKRNDRELSQSLVVGVTSLIS